jgi:hypothetical protein
MSKISIKRQKILEKAVDKCDLKWAVFIGEDRDGFLEFFAIADDETSHETACKLRDMIFNYFDHKMTPAQNRLPI